MQLFQRSLVYFLINNILACLLFFPCRTDDLFPPRHIHLLPNIKGPAAMAQQEERMQAKFLQRLSPEDLVAAGTSMTSPSGKE